MLLLLLLLPWLALQRPTLGSETVQVTFPESLVGAAECRVHSDKGSISTQRGGAQSFRCDSNTSLSCDFASAEPIDSRVETVCKNKGVTLEPAVTVAVTASQLVPTTVEWLEANNRRGLLIKAQRAYSSSEMELRVARLPQRLIRFVRQNSTPATVRGLDLIADRRFVLPSEHRQSELVLQTQSSAVMPSAYQIDGANYAVLDGLTIIQRLPSGSHQVTPLYEGGLKGLPESLDLVARESTFKFMPPAAVGSVRITADPVSCQKSNLVSLVAVRDTPGGTLNQELVGIDTAGGCEQVIAGIPPGFYEVLLGRRSEPFVKRRVEVRSQAATKVHLSVAAITIAGRISLSGRPLAGATVVFSSAADGLIARADTDSTGFYIADVPRAGLYNVGVVRDGRSFMGQQQAVTIREGANTFEWNLSGGEMTVNVRGWDGAFPLTVVVNQTGKLRPGLISENFNVDSSAELPLRLSGLATGEYEVHAVSGRRISGRKAVTIQPDANSSIVVDLAEQSAVMRLRDERGQPIRGASVPGGRETDPGVFSLEAVAPGTRLHIGAPGFTPVCVSVPANGDHEFRLRKGRVVRVDFVGGQFSAPPGTLMWSGTQCPVPLQAMIYGIGERTESNTSVFQILNFPSDTGLLFQMPGVSDQVLDIRGDRVVIRISRE